MSDDLAEARPSEGRAQFLRWKLPGANPGSEYVLSTDGETTVSFLLRVNSPLHGVHHGIGLYDQSRQLLWGNAADGVSLEPGLHEFVYTLPALPLRPGAYSWRVSLHEWGERIDDWECVPQMQVATLPVTHYRDEAAGFLNIPSKLTIVPASNLRAS